MNDLTFCCVLLAINEMDNTAFEDHFGEFQDFSLRFDHFGGV